MKVNVCLLACVKFRSNLYAAEASFDEQVNPSTAGDCIKYVGFNRRGGRHATSQFHSTVGKSPKVTAYLI